MRRAMPCRIPRNGSLRAGAGKPGGISAAALGSALGVVGVLAWASAKARTSDSTTRPRGPLGATCEMSTPRLAAARRAPGVEGVGAGRSASRRSAKARTSDSTTRPPGPVGATCEMSTPRLAATRRAPGVERTASPPLSAIRAGDGRRAGARSARARDGVGALGVSADGAASPSSRT